MRETYTQKNSAMTLIELLVSTVLMSIIMVGGVSVDYAVRSARRSSSLNNTLSIQMQTTLLQISNDAMLTLGDHFNPGVRYDNVGPIRNICFRYDPNEPATPSYLDDEWACYSHNATVNTNPLLRCRGLSSPMGANAVCNDSTTTSLLIISDADFFNVIDDEGKIEFFLTSRPDVTAVAHPIINPQTTLQTSVSPPGVSL